MRQLAISILMIILNSAVAQNLIPNHSFEIIDPCPQSPNTLGYQEGAIPTSWWRWGGTPDYFNACVTDTIGSVPINIWGHQPAFDGNAYSGFCTYYQEGPDGIFRETIGAQLTQNLVIGETYYASMNVSMSMSEYYTLGLANNKIGLLCTMEPHFSIDPINNRFPIQNRAHISATDIITDTSGWVLISGSFIADSAYNYVVLGNHFDNENTDTLYVTGSLPVSYYYVDKVCISTDPQGCDIAHSIDQRFVDPIAIFPNPSEDFFTVRVDPTGFNRVSLFDAAGKTVSEYHGSRTTLIIGQDLSAGVYILRVEAGGIIHHYKLVKR